MESARARPDGVESAEPGRDRPLSVLLADFFDLERRIAEHYARVAGGRGGRLGLPAPRWGRAR